MAIEPAIWLLKNRIMDYPWGSHTAIAEILGAPSPSAAPQAELWMGAHPKAPSEAVVGAGTVPLPALIEKDPAAILGERAVRAGAHGLPFLFKILAAEEPLSIQAHPSLEQAREGYGREDALGVPVTAPTRNYRDRNHKPEILCALSPFWALKGFRPYQEICRFWKELSIPAVKKETEAYCRNPDETGLRCFFETLIRLEGKRREDMIRGISSGVRRFPADSPERRWYFALQERYPKDIGIAAVFLLNLVELAPGEAIFTQAGELHAYLGGTGIELMANSDNVLRGGLTAKHIDVEELLRVVRFAPARTGKISPEVGRTGEKRYPTPFHDFQLTAFEADGTLRFGGNRSVEIWVVVEGEAAVNPRLEGNRRAEGSRLTVHRGQSFLVPAAVPSYQIDGEAKLFRASVPGRS